MTHAASSAIYATLSSSQIDLRISAPAKPLRARPVMAIRLMSRLFDPGLSASRPATGARRWRGMLLSYLGTLLLVTLSTCVALALDSAGLQRTAVPAFMLAVIASAARFGRGPSVFACITSSLAYDFFFWPPVYSLRLETPEAVAAVVFFAIVAAITGSLTSRLRTLAIAEHERAALTDTLYHFRGQLAAAADIGELVRSAAREIARLLPVKAYVFLPEREMVASDTGDIAVAASPMVEAVSNWAQTQAGQPISAERGSSLMVMPLRAGQEIVGLLGTRPIDTGDTLASEKQALLTALLELTAASIERAQLAERAEQSRLHAQSDRLRAALLTSISHDLRSPIAAILGSAEKLAASEDALEPGSDTRAVDIATIQAEAERLNRFITNLLHMTRLECGYLRATRTPTDISDVVGAAFARCRRAVAHHHLKVHVAPNLPLLQLDPVLLEYVLVNLLDNAAKYSARGQTISLYAARFRDSVTIDVTDEGKGIPPAALERIFEKFFRIGNDAGQSDDTPGTGLGLTICRGFVEAMGGSITAANRHDRPGTIMTITLPVNDADIALSVVSE